MPPLLLFTDGSVDAQTHRGYGAYVCAPKNVTMEAIHSLHVKVKVFENTSSTKLELQTLLWALDEVKGFADAVVVHTDSQNIIGLPKRKERFEKSGFLTKKNTLIKNHVLYKEFYQMMDTLKCSLVKVKGHKLSSDKDTIDHLFTLVDRASREALRNVREKSISISSS